MLKIFQNYTDKVAAEYAKLKYEDDQKGKENELKSYAPTKVLFEWESIDRPYISVTPDFFRWITIVGILLVLIFIIFLQWLFAISIVIIYLSLNAFLTSEPDKVVHQITNNGINYAKEELFYWQSLHSFYISSKGNYKYLVVKTYDNFPGELYMILDPKMNPDDLVTLLNEYLPYNEMPQPKNFLEDFFNKYIKN